MKTLLLTGWTTWRLFRLILGLVFIGVGAYRSDYILMAGGAYIAFLSLFNQSCSGGSCNTKT